MVESNEYYDNYDDDFYYNSVLKVNTKHDTGSTKMRRKPLREITLEDEIPQEPQEKLDKPNDSHFEKQIKEIEDQIKKHRESLV